MIVTAWQDWRDYGKRDLLKLNNYVYHIADTVFGSVWSPLTLSARGVFSGGMSLHDFVAAAYGYSPSETYAPLVTARDGDYPALWRLARALLYAQDLRRVPQLGTVFLLLKL